MTSMTDREHQRHQLADAERHVRQLGVGPAKRSLLVLVADERADHPDAGDLLAQHPVDAVDADLHRPEQRPHPDA